MARRILPLFGAFLLPAATCAPSQQTTETPAEPAPPSAVAAPVADEDAAKALAAGAAEFAVLRLGRGAVAAVHVVPASGDAVLAPAIEAALRDAGILVRAPPAPPGPHRLSYRTAPVGADTLLRVELDGATGARLYRGGRGGGLVPAGPLTVMERAR